MKKYFYPFAFVAVLSSILLVASCSKKNDTTATTSSTSTTASTGNTTGTVQKCVAKDVTYTDSTGAVKYTFARNPTSDSLSAYSDGGTNQYTITKVSATSIQISDGTFSIEEVLVTGGLYQTYTQTGTTKSPVTYQYQLLGGSLPSTNTIEYRYTFMKGVEFMRTQWVYDANNNPATELIYHDAPNFSKPDTTIKYTFDNGSVPFSGGLLTKNYTHFSALDFAKHNVLTATYTDSLSNNFGTATYTYSNLAADNISPGTVTITGYKPHIITYSFNCK